MLVVLALVLTLACQAQTITVTGTVLGPDDKAVAGATVVGISASIKEQISSATTDKAGHFSVTLAYEEDNDLDWVGHVAVYAPGLGIGGGRLKKDGTIIRLSPARDISGTVLDTQGKPVAGVELSLYRVGDRKTFFTYIPKPLHTRFTATSDAKGQWAMSNLPTKDTAFLEVSDRRYQCQTFQVPLAQSDEPVPDIVVKPAAQLTGKVVRENGKPAVGVVVSAAAVNYAHAVAVTNADGRYTIGGLPACTATLSFEDPSALGVAAAIPNVQARVGEMGTLPVTTLVAGAIITGTVRDAKTGEPLPRVTLAKQGPDHPNEAEAGRRTGRAGVYRVRVMPGTNTLSFWGIPDAYISTSAKYTFTLRAGETKQQDLTLKKGLTLHGTLVDEAGHPVREQMGLMAGIYVETLFSSEKYTQSDGEGHFTFEGLTPGTKFLVVDSRNDWTLLSTSGIPVPTSVHMQLMVQRTKHQSVTVRVLSPDGKPVPGVRVLVFPDTDGSTPISINFGPLRATSDEHGIATLEKIPANTPALKFSSAVRRGYRFLSGGTVTKTDGRFTLSDIVMSPLTATVQGTVLDTAGTPVAGAQIMAAGEALDAVRASDAAGHFALDRLPQGAVTLFAATATAFGTVTVKSGAADVTLRLAPVTPLPAQNISRAYDLLAALYQETKGTKYDAREALSYELAPYDFNLAMKLAATDGVKAPGYQTAVLMAGHIASVPEAVLTDTLKGLENIKDPQEKLIALGTLGMALVERDPARANALYITVKGLVGQRTDDIEHIIYTVLLATFAGKLKNGEADGLLDRALAAAATNKDADGAFGYMLETVTQAGPALAQRVIDALPAMANRASAISRAILVIARTDTKTARAWLQKINLQEKDATQAYSHAAQRVVAALAKDDPAGALALARTITEPDSRAEALLAAAPFQPKEAQAALLGDIAGVTDTQRMLSIAAQAYALDPAVGRALFAEVLQRIVEGQGHAAVEYAFYYRSVDPAASRVLLESLYAQLRQRSDAHNGWSQLPYAMAMATLDFDRALEIARAIPVSIDDGRFRAVRKLAQYLLAPPAVRATISFTDWSTSDSWHPGMPADR
jgi:hypothetical protein